MPRDCGKGDVMNNQTSTENIVGELERFIFCRAETKPDQDAAMDILHGLERHLKQSDKALKLAAERLVVYDCPPDSGWGECIVTGTHPNDCLGCWLEWLRQKAGEK